ncbi:MAG: SHOCT domain-containing protein [Proteobacteria bacterium]|nr:SHOCT domain-containing protein [Pseudomonadota bacterium]
MDDIQRCPSNYHDMGVTNSSLGGLSTTGSTSNRSAISSIGDTANQLAAQRAAQRAAQQQQQHEQALVNAQLEERRSAERHQNSFLPPDSQCLAGSWRMHTAETNESVQLAIPLNGAISFDGSEIPVIPIYVGSSFSLVYRESAGGFEIDGRLNNGILEGSVMMVMTKNGFWKDTSVRQRGDYTATRITAIPSGCDQEGVSAIGPTSSSPSESSSERGKNLVDSLNQLNQLHQEGILSDEEYGAAKRRLLGL